MKVSWRVVSLVGLVVAGVALATGVVSATHSWGGYHWERAANPVTLQLGDNVDSAWDGYLSTAVSDWDSPIAGYPDVIDPTIVSGATSVRNCKPGDGRIEICNSSYGNNGWLGVAQIWVSGAHITKASVRVNDFYFDSPAYGYDTADWRQMVMCQEIGHTFGLDHQDENFNNTNLGTCMDYTSDPSANPANTAPDAHDFEELALIYEHLDAVDSGSGGGPPPGHGGGRNHAADGSDWGRLVSESKDGGLARYELNLGNGQKVVTFVIRAR